MKAGVRICSSTVACHIRSLTDGLPIGGAARGGLHSPVEHASAPTPFILGSKGHKSRSRVTKNCRHGSSLHSYECWVLLVPAFFAAETSTVGW